MATDARILFDVQSTRFATISDAYCAAITAADELQRCLHRAQRRREYRRVRQLEEDLIVAEAQIATAHAALTLHTCRTLLGPRNERRRPAPREWARRIA